MYESHSLQPIQYIYVFILYYYAGYGNQVGWVNVL